MSSPFRRDEPPKRLEGSRDAFGHGDYANALVSIVLENEAPPTLGLFGPWGLGKTTIIEEVGRLLDRKAAFAYFDVWRYEGDALRRQFLRDVAGQLYPKEADFDPETELSDLEQGSAIKVERFGGLRGDAFRETLLRTVLAALVAFVLLRVVGSKNLRDEHGLLRDVAVSSFLGLLLFVVTPLTKVFRVTEETLSKSRLEDPEHFTERFQALLRSLKNERLVIAVDNLDRCNPSRVEEVLTTIKTYLEPAAQERAMGFFGKFRAQSPLRDVRFIIAADDQALRRHLEAKEAAASGGRKNEAEITRYVDEYLRKFFTGAIRIRPLLDADMKSYTEQELANFSGSHDLPQETSTALIEMVAAALSRNPRRVKQFANNLEGRLRVIKQRERHGGIAPPISGEVLVIAKLAILEEEWPRSFAVLQENPNALDEWHSRVVEGQVPEAPDNGDASFLRFLSRSRSVRSKNLSAFLRLKQAREEIDLPRYSDFIETVRLGTPDEVAKVLEDDPTQVRQYAELLPDLLEEEIERQNVEGARSVIEVATSVPALSAQRDVVKNLLTRAVGDGTLRPGLRALRPRPLFEASASLEPADRQRLLGEFVLLPTFAQESGERLAQVIEAFAEIADSLPPSVRSELQRGLESEEVRSQLEAITPLAVADPNLVPREVADRALETLAQQFVAGSPEFLFIRSWLRRESVPTDIQDTLVNVMSNGVGAQTAAQQPDAAQAEKTLSALQELARQLDGVSAEGVRAFAAVTDQPLAAWMPVTWPSLFGVIGAVATVAPDGLAHLPRLVSEFFTADPNAAIAYSSKGPDSVPPSLHVLCLDQLVALVSGDPPEFRDAAADAIASLDPDDSHERFHAALQRGLERGLFNLVNGLIAKYPHLARSHLQSLAGQTVERIKSVSTADALARGLGLATTLMPSMSEAERDDLRAVMAQAIQRGDDAWVSVVADAVRPLFQRDEFEGRAQELVKNALEYVKAASPPTAAALAFVAEHIDQLGRLERVGFISQLASFVREEPTRVSAVNAVRLLPELEPKEREELVTALITVETMEPVAGSRIDLLRVAREIATNRGNAAKLVKERLQELTVGSDVDQEVRAALEGSPDEPEESPEVSGQE